MLRGLWRAYETQLAANPVRTQMATSCFLWGAGDILAQRIEYYEEQQYGSSSSSNDKAAVASQPDDSTSSENMQQQQHNQTPQQLKQQQQQTTTVLQDTSSRGFTIDQRRTLLTAVGFGAAFVGPVGEFWYSGAGSAGACSHALKPCDAAMSLRHVAQQLHRAPTCSNAQNPVPCFHCALLACLRLRTYISSSSAGMWYSSVAGMVKMRVPDTI
jgi:hypothetical protein